MPDAWERANITAADLRECGIKRAEKGSRSRIHFAEPGVAITIRALHCRFGTQYCEFLGHVGDGKHIRVSKLISSMWKSRWTKPLTVPRSLTFSLCMTCRRGRAGRPTMGRSSMAGFAVMMLSRAGTLNLTSDLRYEHNMHVTTITSHNNLMAAVADAEFYRPKGYNRERIRVWVAPYDDRWNIRICPVEAIRWMHF